MHWHNLTAKGGRGGGPIREECRRRKNVCAVLLKEPGGLLTLTLREMMSVDVRQCVLPVAGKSPNG